MCLSIAVAAVIVIVAAAAAGATTGRRVLSQGLDAGFPARDDKGELVIAGHVCELKLNRASEQRSCPQRRRIYPRVRE